MKRLLLAMLLLAGVISLSGCRAEGEIGDVKAPPVVIR